MKTKCIDGLKELLTWMENSVDNGLEPETDEVYDEGVKIMERIERENNNK
jgi:hypothetical protein